MNQKSIGAAIVSQHPYNEKIILHRGPNNITSTNVPELARHWSDEPGFDWGNRGVARGMDLALNIAELAIIHLDVHERPPFQCNIHGWVCTLALRAAEPVFNEFVSMVPDEPGVHYISWAKIVRFITESLDALGVEYGAFPNDNEITSLRLEMTNRQKRAARNIAASLGMRIIRGPMAQHGSVNSMVKAIADGDLIVSEA